MTEFLANFQWGMLSPLVFLLFVVILPTTEKFKLLKGHFPRGDVALKKALMIKSALPLMALCSASLGLVLATSVGYSIWAWVIGLGGLFVSAGMLSLFYIGPLYPLFDELEDAETRANRFEDTNISQKGN